MCGISGAIRSIQDDRAVAGRPHGTKLRAIVQRMSDSQRHRGPDGAGIWESSGQEVVLGHRRLAILDLSEAGAQPMVDGATGCAVTFNGEIYNFADLRRELESLGEAFRSSCDTEVILKAYKVWGIEAVRRFRGIFAFALWDPAARAVHLVRDQMGIKPLYWTSAADPETGEEILLFASELRALLASGEVTRQVNPAAVASYLWQGFVVGPQTIAAGVQLVPAATIMTISGRGRSHRNETRTLTYWSLPSSAVRKTSVAEVRQELADAVRMQLVADVPLGIFLSGGVDSSAVAAMAAEVAPGTVHTFTVGFDVPTLDEAPFAEQVARAIGSRHTTVVLSEQSFHGQLPQAFSAIDQPTFDGINTYFVSRAARDAGMTVALAGTGGDELFGGYRSYSDIPRALSFGRRLPLGDPESTRRRAFRGVVGAASGLADRSVWCLLHRAPPQTRWGKVADVACALDSVLGLYQTSYALFTRATQAALASELVRSSQRSQEHGLPPEVARLWLRRMDGSDVLHAVSVLELSSFVGERLLRDTDSASMAASLEVRVPLLDHTLAEAVSGLDPVRRFEPLGRKKILRELALARLDPALFDRPKSGFVLPIDTWARQRLRQEMDTLLRDAEAVQRAGLRAETVQMLWRSYLEGRAGLYWSRVWAIYVLVAWCQAHAMRVSE
jgi:asparagine synthase (glutamine-hydrolysing)